MLRETTPNGASVGAEERRMDSTSPETLYTLVRKSASPFARAKFGLRPDIFLRLLRDLPEETRISALDNGYRHWPILAAEGGSVLSLVGRRTDDGRWSTIAPFSLQSLPKGLRSAVTPAVDGHVLIDADWRACHLQILAILAGDNELLTALRRGDVYERVRDVLGGDVKTAKIAVLATLNGAGASRMAEWYPDLELLAVQRTLRGLFAGKDAWFPRAGMVLARLRQDAVAAGVAENEQLAGGVALMYYEAAALDQAALDLNRVLGDLRLICPMREGMLVSVPREQVVESVRVIADVMTRALHVACGADGMLEGASVIGDMRVAGDQEILAELVSPWIKVIASNSWNGSNEGIFGAALRESALGWLAGDDADLRVLGRAVHPGLAQERAAATSGTSKTQWKITESVFSAALRWRLRVQQRNAGTPLVEIGSDPGLAVGVILREDVTMPRLCYNDREGRVMVQRGAELRVLEDADYTELAYKIADRYGILLEKIERPLRNVIGVVARERRFDPVADYFRALPPWDRQERVGTWLTQATGCEDTALHRAYATKTLVGLVRRTFQPGCKFDTMLILVGPQGAGKSRLWRTLAPGGSYGEVRVDPYNKDSVLTVARLAIAEWEG